ncbi:DNA-directed RNA polymerase subunit beta [Bacillus suaedae]|uniref:DNA-directed RNA polymerase subunit beta n=1 Tax=Halalkalibacter suaedae TaxID=2822140 RepID=A0A941APV4_9BACI|nr:DNA-directed RNA polymerase subunit beta [Bacillus suaedae]MBP3953185.1 DNA-directed RNA polymerase subunit beta [Bacillus suaedae]
MTEKEAKNKQLNEIEDLNATSTNDQDTVAKNLDAPANKSVADTIIDDETKVDSDSDVVEEPSYDDDSDSKSVAELENESEDQQVTNDKQESKLAEDEEQETETEKREARRKRRRRPRLRIIPIWLRLLISIVLIGGSLILGLMVGFGVIGDGENPSDILDPDIWYRMIDIIRGR